MILHVVPVKLIPGIYIESLQATSNYMQNIFFSDVLRNEF